MAITTMHPDLNINTVILFVGFFVTAYTVRGGFEAVIWTDVFQSFVFILGGLVVIVVACSSIDGGMWTVYEMGISNGKMSLLGKNAKSAFDLSLARETLLVFLLYGAMNSITEHALHQTHVQRYCAASSKRGAQSAVMLGALSCLPVWLLFMFVGTCLWVFYQVNPAQIGHEMLADEVFPHFILTQLPSGVGGLVIAGLLAAAMSSIDSSMNGATTVISEDIYKRILIHNREDSHYLKAAKAIAICSGILMTLIAFGLTLLQQETILEVIFFMSAVLVSGFGSLFLIGFFTLRANSFGVIIGIVLSLMLTCSMTFIEVRAMIWESKVKSFIQDSIDQGTVNADRLIGVIAAEAEAQGKQMHPADIEDEKNIRIRRILAPRIESELGAAPPHLTEVFGIHPFLIGVIANLTAFLFGYLFSFLRPPKPREELHGLTWHTRNATSSQDGPICK